MGMTLFLEACFVCLQGAFIWGRIAFFRVEGSTPFGVRLIEVSATAGILIGIVTIAGRYPSHAALDAAALGVAACSAALFAWGISTVNRRQLTAAFSADPPAELLTTGAFRLVRNPFYLSYILAYAMPVVATRSVPSALCFVWMSAIYIRAALLEEQKFLGGSLARAYRGYASRTGRFLPRLPGIFRG